MQVDRNGRSAGNSPIGDAIARNTPDSWMWTIELWTRQDCIQALAQQGVREIDGQELTRASIGTIEAYLLRTTAPHYNRQLTGDQRDTVSQPLQDAEAQQLDLWPSRLPDHDSSACSEPLSVEWALAQYQESLVAGRTKNTARTYTNAVHMFIQVLRSHGVDPNNAPVESLDEDALLWLQAHVRSYAPSTEKLYLHAIRGFYDFLAGADLANVNLSRARLLLRPNARHSGGWLPQFPADDIARLLDFVQSESLLTGLQAAERLRALRDRAFLVTLADTGLRVHEACRLRRGDVDWNEGRAVIIGKGDKQAVVRFSERALRALRAYTEARAALDGTTGKPLASLPLFARHDKGAGGKIKPITTARGRNIVHERVAQALGESASGSITPHSLRHYFVTTVLRASGNLKMAQELARHTSIQVTQRYAHLSNDELDRGYHEIFDRNASDKTRD